MLHASARIMLSRDGVFLIALLLLSLLVYIVYTLKHSTSGIPDVQYVVTAHDGRNISTGLYLQGHVYSLDTVAYSIDIFWQYLGCGGYAIRGLRTAADIPTCTLPNMPINFFIDDFTVASKMYNPHLTVVYRADDDSPITIPGTAEFQTTHNINWDGRFGYDQLFTYPFDQYKLTTTFRAVSADLNASLSILATRVYDATNSYSANMRLDADTVSRQWDPLTGNHTGFPVRTVQVTLTRSPIVRAFVIVVFIGGWILTFGMVYFVARTLKRASDGDSTALSVVISVGVTLPAFRALWAGAPPLGVLLDMCSTVPQTVILVVCLLQVSWKNTYWSARQDIDMEQTAALPAHQNNLHLHSFAEANR